ncbi:hypothetical protein EIP91_005040 [Steccherinum ochraceum]|uniref:Uncharacterized protein n=1 Tax=Steccherinum ochraceum TaxID=92696 RepID=A0A4R0RW48_9APHY|nr:hypothetical protein EIP91_005040 [Steccherinum ochraceum]
MPSVEAAFHDFLKALTGIFSAIANSIFGVFRAVLALFQEVFGAVFHLFNALAHLVTDLTQTMFGFVFANFFALLIIGGGVYWYTQRQGSSVSKGKRKA